MDIRSFNALLAAILSLIVGVYPYFYRKNNVTRLFALSNICLAVWNMADLVVVMPISSTSKVWTVRIGYEIGIFVVWFFFHFILAFIKIDPLRYPRTLNVMRIVGGALILLSLTPLVIADISKGAHPFEIPGPLFPLFAVYLIATLGFALSRMFKAYRGTVGQERAQFRCLFVALFFGFSEAVFFVFDIYTQKLGSFYYYFQVIYSLLVAYAILAHRLMDITLIIQKTVIYSVVTGALTAVYLLIATQLAHLLEGYAGSPGLWSSAVAAATVTILFNPLLNRVRVFMDERFFGEWLQDMSRGVVHEVKRPLASISMPAQLTLMDLEDVENGKRPLKALIPVLKERMRGIVEKTAEAADRIEALYALSDSDAHEPKSVEIQDVVQASLSAAKELLEKCPVSLTIEMSKMTSSVRGDAKQFEIVFLNLIKNAVEAMRPGEDRRLRLKISEEGKWAVFSVKDSGPGIDAADRPQLFTPHFTTKGGAGMGLGLYLSEKIVRGSGGSIEVISEVGKGTEFVVRLPRN